jgi:hypothetical protein
MSDLSSFLEDLGVFVASEQEKLSTSASSTGESTATTAANTATSPSTTSSSSTSSNSTPTQPTSSSSTTTGTSSSVTTTPTTPVQTPVTVVATPTNPPLTTLAPTTPTPEETIVVTVPSSVTMPAQVVVKVEIDASVQLNNVLIDVEIYDSNNNQVAQFFEANQNITAKGNLQYNNNFAPTKAGTYSVSVGIFDSPTSTGGAWGTKHVFTSNLATFTVEAAPAFKPTTTNTSGFYLSTSMQVDQYVASDPQLAAIADVPQGLWVGQWDDLSNSTAFDPSTISGVMASAKEQSTTPIIVIYNVPNRDNGGYSAGGAENEADYESWITELAEALTTPSLVILEPDAISLGVVSYLPDLMAFALSKLKPMHQVYLDGGGSTWNSAQDQAQRLVNNHVAQADGFFANVSGFNKTSDVEAYGNNVLTAMASLGVTGKKFVIDTSRNGVGNPSGQTFNPPNVALGTPTTTKTDESNCAAYLWVKAPGESDGTANGGPSAGTFWQKYADELVSGKWS